MSKIGAEDAYKAGFKTELLKLAKEWERLTSFGFMSLDQVRDKETFLIELANNQNNLLDMVNDAAGKIYKAALEVTT